MNKRRIVIILIIVIVIIISGCLGVYFSKKTLNNNPNVAEAIVIDKDSNYIYKPVLIKTYDDYYKLLNALNISDVVLLTNNSFNEKDFIVDYIDYSDKLKIKDISVNFDESNNSLSISYYVNTIIKDSDKYLMYFIPIEKDLIEELNISKREIKAND